MGGEVVAEEKCKRMVEVNGRYRCELRNMPRSSTSNYESKEKGAQVILTGSCGD